MRPIYKRKSATYEKRRGMFICGYEGCTNRVQKGGGRESAKRKTCSEEGFNNHVILASFNIKPYIQPIIT